MLHQVLVADAGTTGLAAVAAALAPAPAPVAKPVAPAPVATDTEAEDYQRWHPASRRRQCNGSARTDAPAKSRQDSVPVMTLPLESAGWLGLAIPRNISWVPYRPTRKCTRPGNPETSQIVPKRTLSRLGSHALSDRRNFESSTSASAFDRPSRRRRSPRSASELRQNRLGIRMRPSFDCNSARSMKMSA